MNLYEKINKIMGDIEYLKKDGKAEFGSTKYKFLSEAKTTTVFRDKLIENKIALFPIHAEETARDKITHGIYTYRMVNVENPEEYIDLMTTGQGHDSTDKGSGKASSYAYKYLLWRTFAIPSGDDPDQITSEETEDKEREQAEKEKKAAAEARHTALRDEYIKYLRKLNGSTFNVQDHYQKTYKHAIYEASEEELSKAVEKAKAAVEKKDPTT
jgi:hypothetical protein